MPIYEYECRQCGKNLEIMQKFSDAPISVCSDCGGEMKKLISNTSFVLKGSGWYVTDYASSDRQKGMDCDNGKSKRTSETKDKTNTDSTASKSDPVSEAKSETKTDSKTESKTESKADSKTEAPSTK